MAAVEIKIPTLGESVNEGVIARWLKRSGEAVAADEPLIELETDKAVMEIPAEAGGRLEILVQEGETVTVGQVIAKVDPDAEGAPAAKAPDKAEEKPEPKAAPAPAKAKDDGAAANGGTPPLSPAVRKLVTEHDLDPEAISGTGKGGRLTKADVLQHLEAQPAEASAQPQPAAPPAKAPASKRARGEGVRREPMSKIRQRIAERLVQAQHTAAILTTFNDVDLSAVMAMRQKHKARFEEKHGVKLGFMSLFGRAVVLALAEIPQLNAQIDGEEIVYHDHVHLGIAVSTERGLMVPVVRHAEALSVAELEAAIGALAEKGRTGKVAPDELGGGTFSITNGGVFGSLLSTPILNPPQSGILGMHRIEQRPVAVDGKVEIRPMMYLALSYDHRLVDGKEAVTFLVRVKEFLEDPERMLLDV